MIIGNAVSERQENAVVNEGTNYRDFTVGTFNNDSVVNGNAMSVKTLERCFNERIDREMSNIIDTVEDRIQKAILIAIDNIVAPKIELAIRLINASSGRDVTSVSANSERREHVAINASFENASGNNNTLGVSNANDETPHNIPDEVSELSVPEIHFDRQPHTHHTLRHFLLRYCNSQCLFHALLRSLSSGLTCHVRWKPNLACNGISETSSLDCGDFVSGKKFSPNVPISHNKFFVHRVYT